MDFLLSHWHCIVPVILIAAVLLLQGKGMTSRAIKLETSGRSNNPQEKLLRGDKNEKDNKNG